MEKRKNRTKLNHQTIVMMVLVSFVSFASLQSEVIKIPSGKWKPFLKDGSSYRMPK